MEIPTSCTYVYAMGCRNLRCACALSPTKLCLFGGSFFDIVFMDGPVSILHPFTIFKWFMYTFVHVVFLLIKNEVVRIEAVEFKEGFHCS